MENMENMGAPQSRPTPNNGVPRQPNPRRRKRDPKKEFIQNYLPAILIVLVIILFIVFAISSCGRSKQRKEDARKESIAAEQEAAQQEADWQLEASRLLATAETLAAGYDYDGAIETIESFSGDLYNYSKLVTAISTYENAKEGLVAWKNPGKIKNLSFNLLIADPERAFKDKDNGNSFNRNFITVSEFTSIITQLHQNGYVLVDLDDIIEEKVAEDGSVTYAAKTVYLPEGKTPIMLTQTHVNYNTYMVDGNGDGIADKDGSGFASRLIVGADGKVTCEYIDKYGDVLTGAYDMVPILSAFIESHPDFSYKGARATLAVSGYDGLFGYRTTPKTATKISQDFYDQQIQQVPAVIKALREEGYTIACYTYGNLAYGRCETADIEKDLKRWADEVTPLLGEVDILVYAKESEISSYNGTIYDVLEENGFKYFLGFCDGVTTYADIDNGYVHMGRILIHGANLKNNVYLYNGLFEPKTVLDPAR